MSQLFIYDYDTNTLLADSTTITLTYQGASLLWSLLIGSRPRAADHVVVGPSTSAVAAAPTDTGADVPLNAPGIVFFQVSDLYHSDIPGFPDPTISVRSFLENTGGDTVTINSCGMFWADWQSHAPSDLDGEPLIIRVVLSTPLDMAPGDRWLISVSMGLSITDVAAPPVLLTGDTASSADVAAWSDRELVVSDFLVGVDHSLWFQPHDTATAHDRITWGDRDFRMHDQVIGRESWFREDLGAETAGMVEVATLLQSDVQVETWSWTADRRHYLRRHPSILQLARLINQSTGRSYDTEGRALLLRILQAALAASHDLRPAAHYPQAQHATFGALRRMLWRALYGHIATSAEGHDGPLLTEGAAGALTILETQDTLMTRPPDRVATLDRLIAGIGWRSNP